MGWMGIGWLILAGLLGLAIWAVATAGRRQGGDGETPREIPRRRYARGEIDREAYDRMLRELGG